MSATLVLATRNAKKRREIEEILGDLGLTLHDLSHYPGAPEVTEDGTTFEANARKKAMEIARAVGQWTLGEDSGLVVPALNGRPGVYSARYAGKQGDDSANNTLIYVSYGRELVQASAKMSISTVALYGQNVTWPGRPTANAK